MATRSSQFFMRVVEYSAIVSKAVQKLGLSVILARLGLHRHLELSTDRDGIVMADGKPADWVFLARGTPDLAAIDPRDLRPGEWGWVHGDVSKEEGNVLFIARLAAKSDWYDAGDKAVYENPESIQLFRRVLPFFRRRLKRPVWVWNVRGGGASPYRNIGYSEGAAEWERHGGDLRQWAVANIRYSTMEPKHLLPDAPRSPGESER